MKKIITAILVIAMTVGMVSVFASCEEEVACTHVDADKNSLCDLCGAPYAVCSHMDPNSDGICELCNAEFTCEGHVDENLDTKCDLCAAYYVDEKNPISGVFATIEYYKNSAPTKVHTTSETKLISYNGRNPAVVNTLYGEWILKTGVIDGKKATVQTYWRDVVADLDSGSDTVVGSEIERIEGSEEYLEGMGRRTDGKKANSRWKTGYNFAPSAGSIAIDLSNLENFTVKSYTKEKNNNTLTLVVSVDAVAEVFGVNADGDPNLLADSDVEVVITNNGATVTSISVSYIVEGKKDYPEQEIYMKTTYGYAEEKVELVK